MMRNSRSLKVLREEWLQRSITDKVERKELEKKVFQTKGRIIFHIGNPRSFILDSGGMSSAQFVSRFPKEEIYSRVRVSEATPNK